MILRAVNISYATETDALLEAAVALISSSASGRRAGDQINGRVALIYITCWKGISADQSNCLQSERDRNTLPSKFLDQIKR